MSRGFPRYMDRLTDVEPRDGRSRGGRDLDIVFGGIQGGDIGTGTGKDHPFSGLLEQILGIIHHLFESWSG
jgi:hypothetical protein